MGTVFLKVFNMGFTASWLILVVVILRLLLRRAPKWISCLLWALVAVKLLCPFSLESAVSLIPSNEPLPEKIITGNTFRVNTGVGIMDSPVNEYLEDHYYEGVSVAADNGFHVMTALGMIWITVVILLLLYSFISYYRLHRLTRASVKLKDNIFACDAVDTPFILGVVKPRIYLPSAMESAQTEYVLAHERAHLKRGDHIWKPVGFLILTVYWFWPPCLLSYILFCRDIELACDERVIASLGQENRRSYAEALLSCSVKQSMVTACPLAFGEVGVKERIKNVLHYKKPAFWMILVAVVACLVAAVCFLTNPKKEEKAEETPVTQERQEVQEKVEEQVPAVSGNEDALLKLLKDWQIAFCERDGEAIAGMVTPELAGRMLYGTEGNYSFGWSSPWPWDSASCAKLYQYDQERAVIYYYAMTSDPHVTSWKETLEYRRENDRYVITNEELICYDKIVSGAEFQDAYHGTINGSMMDYISNGFGEQLNENALLNSSTAYRDLFEPESAAAFLLNLSDEPEKVKLTLHEQEGRYARLDILFLEEQETFTISMTQPFGEDGICVPVDYQIDVVERFRNVGREKLRALPFDPNVISFEDVLCIGELPEDKIRVYGYNDDEVGACGVAVEMEFPAEGREIYYYDWYYVTPRGILPALYWDKAKERLSIACTIYTGTGADAQELHILQRYGTMQETSLSLEQYTTLLEKRIDWQFEEDTRKLTLTDKKTGKMLAELTVPTDLGERVTDLELGTISKFILGEEIRFVVSPGYVVDDMWGGAVYDEMPELTFELLLTDGGNGHFEFALGEITPPPT